MSSLANGRGWTFFYVKVIAMANAHRDSRSDLDFALVNWGPISQPTSCEPVMYFHPPRRFAIANLGGGDANKF